jgi:hypothetical protein
MARQKLFKMEQIIACVDATLRIGASGDAPATAQVHARV